MRFSAVAVFAAVCSEKKTDVCPLSCTFSSKVFTQGQKTGVSVTYEGGLFCNCKHTLELSFM